MLSTNDCEAAKAAMGENMKRIKRKSMMRKSLVITILASLILSGSQVRASEQKSEKEVIQVDKGDFSINPEDLIIRNYEEDIEQPISMDTKTKSIADGGVGIEISDEFEDIIKVLSFESTDNEDSVDNSLLGVTLEVIEVIEDAEETDGADGSASMDVSDGSAGKDVSDGSAGITLAAAMPDLEVTSITPINAPFIGLRASNFEVKVANKGTAPTNAFSYELKVDGKYLVTLDSTSIPAGGGRILSVTIGNLPAGNHTFSVIADCYNEVAESNESNNSRTGTYTWSGAPDLIMTRFDFNTLNPVIGESFFVYFYVKNNGNADIKNTFYVDININGSTFARIDIPGLGAQKDRGGAIMFAFDTNESYKLQAKADSTNIVAESNEANNNSTIYTVQPRKAPQINISGRLQYYSYEVFTGARTLRNLSNYQIKIYEKGPSSSAVKATITTDANGYFSTVINNTSSFGKYGCSLYLGVPMDNSYVKIVEPNKSETYQLVSDTYENWMKGTLDMGIMALKGNELQEGVANIYHWIKAAKDFYQSEASQLGKVTAVWAPSADRGSYYDPNTMSIYYNGIKYAHKNASVITHEYGHYIMDYKNVSPSNAGGEHSFTSPCQNNGTAYSEAYASFISLQVRNKTTYDDIKSTTSSMSANFETLRYTQKGSSYDNTLVNRRTRFYENAKMELFTGGAMLDFADEASDGYDTYFGGFNDVNDVVMSKRISDSIDFYNTYMNKMSTAGSKIRAWKIFNQNNSAFDYSLPQVRISGDLTFIAIANDNVGIEQYEWYLDGSLVLSGPSSYRPPANLSLGTHQLEVRVYDYEGVARKDTNREDINGYVVRTKGYGYAKTTFRTTSTAYSSEKVPVYPNILNSSKVLSENFEFDSNKLYNYTGIHQNASLNSRDTELIVIDDNTDLYLMGFVDGAVNSINIVNRNGEVIKNVGGIYNSEYTIMSNLPSGEYTLEIDAVDKNQQIPYSINIFAVPSVPELSIPKSVSGKNKLEIHNPYCNELKVSLNQKEYSLLPDETKEIYFDEGENKLVYYSENEYGKSEKVEKLVYCDTIAPAVEIKKAVSDGEILVITGQISEVSDQLYVNNEMIFLGECFYEDEPIVFTYILEDTNISVLDIEATDAYGNSFATSIDLQW